MTPGDIPHRTPGAASVFLFAVLLWLLPLSIWAYATRPTAAVSEPPRHASHYGPAHTARESTDIAGRKVSK